jgi:hypothetical protein
VESDSISPLRPPTPRPRPSICCRFTRHYYERRRPARTTPSMSWLFTKRWSLSRLHTPPPSSSPSCRLPSSSSRLCAPSSCMCILDVSFSLSLLVMMHVHTHVSLFLQCRLTILLPRPPPPSFPLLRTAVGGRGAAAEREAGTRGGRSGIARCSARTRSLLSNPMTRAPAISLARSLSRVHTHLSVS